MNIRLDAFICYTELVPDCALGEAFEYDRSTNILLLERVYAGGLGLDAAMLCFGNRLVGVNEASIPYNRNILSSFAAGSYALEYDHCGRQVAKYCCGMTYSELEEFASVCRTASLTTSADEYDHGGYALSPVPTAWPGDAVWAKYYNDYRFVAVRGLGTDFAFEASASAPFYASATGLLTGIYTGSGYEVYYYDSEGREVQRYATGYNRGRRCTAYNYDGTIASRTYSYKESYLPDMEEVYVYDSCGRLTSTTIRVDKAVSVPVLNPAAGQDAADSEATDTASPAASSRWATAVIRREYDAIGRLARLRHGDAAVTEYSYDVHSWPVSQQTTYGMGSNSSSIGYTLEYAPCYNGNISKRTWAEGGYAYTYDALNRLESAVFTPAEGLADRPGIERDRIPDFSVYYCYDLRGNMTNVVRYGVVDAVSDFDRVETFGTLDELACSYDGNRLSNVTAITEALPFDGVTGLHADGKFELAYNEAGDMVSDASRGLLHTRWNADGHPMQYDLEGGHRQLLGWDAFGNHLYTSYETSVAPVSAGMRPGRTRRTSLRAYSGDGHVLRGGAGNSAADTLEMLRFAGGYFDANLVPYYYVTDYLGSNIAVIRSDGTLVQSATYYPYGEPHRDPAASATIGIAGPEQQTASATFSNPYLYGDKEYIRRDGLREYIYGARMCVPSVTRFNSMDELCELRPWESPYLFCGGNPVRYVDPTGLVFTRRSMAIVEAIESQSLKQLMESIGKVVSGLCSYILSGNKESLKEAFNAAKTNAQTIDEIETLKSSQTAYDIEVKSSISDDKEVKGASYYKWRVGKFKIEILDDKAYGWIAHELKHAYQFETGKLSTGTTEEGAPFYDKDDEREAYARGQLFGENMPTFSENEAGYGELQNGPKQVDPKASDAELQKLANDHNAWFKANGKIYSPPIK